MCNVYSKVLNGESVILKNSECDQALSALVCPSGHFLACSYSSPSPIFLYVSYYLNCFDNTVLIEKYGL